MKITDFLREIAEKGGIRDNDFEAAIGASALAAVEIPDTIKDKFHASYLTRERAKSDPEIVTGIGKDKSKEIFGNVDARIETLMEFISDEDKTKIKGTFETFKKLDLLKEAISTAIKAKKPVKDPEDVRKVEEEWSGKVKALQNSHLEEITNLKKQHKETSLTTALKLKINENQFGEAFRGIKDTLSNSIIDNLRKEQVNGNPIVLEQGDDGIIHVRQVVDGNTRDVFDKDQNKITVDSLLQKHVDPFIVKSNGKEKEKEKQMEKKIVTLPVNPTLHEMRLAGAQ